MPESGSCVKSFERDTGLGANISVVSVLPVLKKYKVIRHCHAKNKHENLSHKTTLSVGMDDERESLLRASIQNLSRSVQHYGVERGKLNLCV